MLLLKTCAGCGRAGGRGIRSRPFCEGCVPATSRVGAVHGLAGLDAAAVLHRYDGPVRAAVVAAKTGARPDVLRYFGREMAALALTVWPRSDIASDLVSLVTWVPASRAGRVERGYDQGKLLAGAVGSTLGVPVRRVLTRTGHGSQVGRGRSQRMAGPKLQSRGPVHGRVLVVDDVITTGASLRCAATGLRAAGAAEVVGLCIAWAASADEIARARPSRPGADLGRSSSA